MDYQTTKKAIAKIKTTAAKLDDEIQTIGLSVLEHCADHRECSLADQLINALGKGQRRLALADWLIKYGSMRAITAKTKADKAALASGRVFQFIDKPADIDGAKESPWYNCRKEKAVSEVFDAGSAAKRFLARLTSAVTGGEKIEHPLEAVKSFEAAIKALQELHKQASINGQTK